MFNGTMLLGNSFISGVRTRLHRVIYLPHPDANGLSRWSTVKQQLTHCSRKATCFRVSIELFRIDNLHDWFWWAWLNENRYRIKAGSLQAFDGVTTDVQDTMLALKENNKHWSILLNITNKVITTMGIRPLDDVISLWSPICDILVWGTWGSGMSSLGNPLMGSY